MEQDSVRRCRKCGQSAVIIVNRWERRLFGVLALRGSGKTEHRCQACGAGFWLQPPLLLRFVVGAMGGGMSTLVGLLSLVGSVIALFTQGPAEAAVLVVVGAVALSVGAASLVYWAGPQIHAWQNPLVLGARVPELRYGPAESRRVCGCGAVASCVEVAERSLNGLPAGTRRTYACAVCRERFTVVDAWSVTVKAAGAAMLTGATVLLASLLPIDEWSSSNIFVLVVLALGAVVCGVLAVHGVRGRLRHPPAVQA